VVPFERQGFCLDCGKRYVISGAAIAPGAETEEPARFFCACGGLVEAFLPGSVNRERVVVTAQEEASA
jgi:hypothetical protein